MEPVHDQVFPSSQRDDKAVKMLSKSSYRVNLHAILSVHTTDSSNLNESSSNVRNRMHNHNQQSFSQPEVN